MTYAFDTLRFTQRLEQVGVGREQAVAHAELARDMILADLATKADLAIHERALKAEIVAVRTDLATVETALKTEIVAVRTDLATVETTLKTDIIAVRTDLVGMKKEIDGSLRELELRMTIKLGALVVAAVAAVAALQKFL